MPNQDVNPVLKVLVAFLWVAWVGFVVTMYLVVWLYWLVLGTWLFRGRRGRPPRFPSHWCRAPRMLRRP